MFFLILKQKMQLQSFNTKVRIILFSFQMIRTWPTTVREIQHKIMNNNHEGRREKTRLFYRVHQICVKIFITITFERIPVVMNVTTILVRENTDCRCSRPNGYSRPKSILTDHWRSELDGRLRL